MSGLDVAHEVVDLRLCLSIFDVEVDTDHVRGNVRLDERVEAGVRAASKHPSAPPVEMMYFFPALTKDCKLVATSAGVTPPQFSLPHSPVANARVRVVSPVGITCVTGVIVPVTDELMTLVFQFRLIVMSL